MKLFCWERMQLISLDADTYYHGFVSALCEAHALLMTLLVIVRDWVTVKFNVTHKSCQLRIVKTSCVALSNALCYGKAKISHEWIRFMSSKSCKVNRAYSRKYVISWVVLNENAKFFQLLNGMTYIYSQFQSAFCEDGILRYWGQDSEQNLPLRCCSHQNYHGYLVE